MFTPAFLLHITTLWFHSSTEDAANVRIHEVVYKKTSFPSDRQLRGIWIRRRSRHYALFHCQDQTPSSCSEQPIRTRERKTFSPLRDGIFSSRMCIIMTDVVDLCSYLAFMVILLLLLTFIFQKRDVNVALCRCEMLSISWGGP